MARIKIELPSTFTFSTIIPIRITDLNYGGHVGNDKILSLIHEARIQFLASFGYSELNLAGVATIMGDVAISYKSEVFYGDHLRIYVTVKDISKVSFTLYYKLEKESEEKIIPVAHAQTGMVCFDYERKKITSIPEEALLTWRKKVTLKN